jgi:hypothetical protein
VCPRVCPKGVRRKAALAWPRRERDVTAMHGETVVRQTWRGGAQQVFEESPPRDYPDVHASAGVLATHGGLWHGGGETR